MKLDLKELINKITTQFAPPFSTVQTISSFPYTATHSGIMTIFIVSGSTSVVRRGVTIKDNTTNRTTSFEVYFTTAYAGASFQMPVIKGHQYAITDGASYVYASDGRTYLTY